MGQNLNEPNPWDGVVGAVKEVFVTTKKAVKDMLPWEGVDTTPDPKSAPRVIKEPSPVDVSTEPKMISAAKIQPHEVMSDTQSAASNLAEIDTEIANAMKSGNSRAVKILQQERKKYVK